MIFRIPVNSFYAVMLPSGEKFLVVAPEHGEQSTLHTVVLNWPALLDRK